MKTKIQNQKWQKLLNKHKATINQIKKVCHDTQKLNSVITNIRNQSLKLRLHFANYQCEKPGCKEKQQLTIHHMMLRRNKKYTDPNTYLTSRYYWNSQIILCPKHHGQIHGRNIKNENNYQMNTLQQHKINAVKKYFEE